MSAELTVDADLEFSLEIPGSRTLSGVLTGSGKRMELRVSDPLLFAGKSDASAIRGLAKALAGQGLVLSVIAPSGPLVTLGVSRTSWLQRRVTGSRHIRIDRSASLWLLLRGRSRAATGGALPVADLAPPPTLFPIAPTMARQPRQPVTTTHARPGDGNPRMIMAPRRHPKPDDRRPVFALRKEVTTIGSGPGCDIRLPRLEPLHAEIRHDDEDEYVLVRVSGVDGTRVNGAPVDSAVLRTASRVQVGEWTMSFYREEYADHGRPFGGRIGGELGYQRAQPDRAQLAGRSRQR
jgi:hypothetical protein